MSVLRPEIASLRNNGITGVALPRMTDPEMFPLWFGEGDIPTPDFIRDAAKKALDEAYTFYSHTRGRAELRETIHQYLNDLYNIDLDFNRITVPGSTMLGITISAQMALTNGSHGLIVSPAWPNVEAVFQITGCDYEHIRQQPVNGRWQLNMQDLYAAVRPNTRVIFVNSPCNPTGWVMTSDEQRELLAFCRERQIMIIADEVYHRTVFDRKAAPSFLEVAEPEDPVVVISGFSKAWAMTGWRIGWVVSPASWGEQWAAMSECFNTGTPPFVQLAAMAALEQGEPFVNQLLQQYAGGLDLVMDALGNHPRVDMLRPEGAFYAFPRIRGVTDSMAFAEQLADETKVGLAPGYTFGPGNDEHVRLCFAMSHDRLGEALRRMVQFIDRMPG